MRRSLGGNPLRVRAFVLVASCCVLSLARAAFARDLTLTQAEQLLVQNNR